MAEWPVSGPATRVTPVAGAATITPQATQTPAMVVFTTRWHRWQNVLSSFTTPFSPRWPRLLCRHAARRQIYVPDAGPGIRFQWLGLHFEPDERNDNPYTASPKKQRSIPCSHRYGSQPAGAVRVTGESRCDGCTRVYRRSCRHRPWVLRTQEQDWLAPYPGGNLAAGYVQH